MTDQQYGRFRTHPRAARLNRSAHGESRTMPPTGAAPFAQPEGRPMLPRALGLAFTVLAVLPAVAAAAPELSTTDRLVDRRYVSAGDRAYVMGFEDGNFYAQGWHI